MATDETYNGWKNYPTWAVNLWLTNDRGSYDWLTETTSREYAEASDCEQVREGIWTVEQARRFNLADTLKDEVRRMSEDPFDRGEVEASMAADLLGYAFDCVEWHEIADAALAAWAEGLEYA